MSVDGQIVTQLLIIFAVVALLALVLRWTFGRDAKVTWPPAETPAKSPNESRTESRPESPTKAPTKARSSRRFARRSGQGSASDFGQADDYGLLASVATCETVAEAVRIRSILAEAGIKATTTTDRSGRVRVLVFSAELHRARRAAGGSP